MDPLKSYSPHENESDSADFVCHCPLQRPVLGLGLGIRVRVLVRVKVKIRVRV